MIRMINIGHINTNYRKESIIMRFMRSIFRLWKDWAIWNDNSWLYKFEVLFGMVHSPSFEYVLHWERPGYIITTEELHKWIKDKKKGPRL